MTAPSVESPIVSRVRSLVEPIAADLDLDIYDVEQRGGTLRVTLDTRPGSSAGIDLDQLALATRLVSRELDHADPVPGRYTLEVTSPGVERSLRTPAHFQREIGKAVNLRLSDVGGDKRRLTGVLVAADATAVTVRIHDAATGDAEAGAPVDETVAYAQIDRARTVFEWGPQPKPGGPRSGGSPKGGKQAGGARHTPRADGQQSGGEVGTSTARGAGSRASKESES